MGKLDYGDLKESASRFCNLESPSLVTEEGDERGNQTSSSHGKEHYIRIFLKADELVVSDMGMATLMSFKIYFFLFIQKILFGQTSTTCQAIIG